MKKLLVLLVVVCFFLASCDRMVRKNDDVIELTATPSYECLDETNGLKQYGRKKFLAKFNRNAIDYSFNNLNLTGTTEEMIKITNEYKSYWEHEIESSYNTLLEQLCDEEKDMLVKSQNAWREYMDNDDFLKKSFYYDVSPYGIATSEKKLLMAYEEMEKTRDRAKEIMFYLYELTGEVSFSYKEE